MFRRDLNGTMLWIPRCRAVHTCFMLVPIDLLFLDHGMRVVLTRPRVAPWRFVWGRKEVDSVLELPAGYLEQQRIEAGDVIEWV